MLVKTFLKGIWRGLRRIDEDPWLFMGSAAVILSLVLLTVGVGTMGRVRRTAEPRRVASTVDATSRR